MATDREIRAGIDNFGLRGSLVLASANSFAIISFYMDAFELIPDILLWLNLAVLFNLIAICTNLYLFRTSRHTSLRNELWRKARKAVRTAARDGDVSAKKYQKLKSKRRTRKREYKRMNIWSKICWWFGFSSIAAGYIFLSIGFWLS